MTARSPATALRDVSAALQYGERVMLLDVKKRRVPRDARRGRRVPLPRRLRAARRHRRRRRRASSCARRRAPSTPCCARRSRTSSSRCPAVRRSSTRRTWRRSACSPTSAPGTGVFESGVGSGALSMTMLRWGADIVGYELREDFANRARANVRGLPRRRRARSLPGRAPRQLRGHRRRPVRPCRARPARSRGGSSRTPRTCCAPGGSSSPTRPRSSRRRRPARRCGASGSTPAPSRCCTAPGTSRARPSVRTTGWWPTRAS